MNQSLYQLNTKVYLSTLGRSATLDDIPDDFLQSLASRGFEWLWLLGVWTIGETGRAISRERREWRREYLEILPDLSEGDVCGSPFAVCSYTVDPSLGGDAALAKLRKRLAACGIRLLLDFVPNHIGFDHPWVTQHPDYLIAGTEELLKEDPGTWTRLPDGRITAFGRDPNYPGWPDTVQLNFFNPALRLAMLSEIQSIAQLCDGVRCDMAMLVEPEVFRQTWEPRAPHVVQGFESFWPESIRRVREQHPDFIFIAEVYWGYEYKLQQHGFDYTYDKTLYDRVLARNAAHLREHFIAPLSYQQHMTRFLENHDERRIAAQLSPAEHRAAAVLTYLSPGLRFFHDGQLTGKRVRVPVHLKRGPQEKPNPEVSKLYERLLPIIHSPPSKHGAWNLLDSLEAWPGNPTHRNFIAFLIEHPLENLVVCVNYAPYCGQCFVRIPEREWLSGKIRFTDKLSHERLVRSTGDLRERGLFLDCEGWQCHIFSIDEN